MMCCLIAATQMNFAMQEQKDNPSFPQCEFGAYFYGNTLSYKSGGSLCFHSFASRITRYKKYKDEIFDIYLNPDANSIIVTLCDDLGFSWANHRCEHDVSCVLTVWLKHNNNYSFYAGQISSYKILLCSAAGRLLPEITSEYKIKEFMFLEEKKIRLVAEGGHFIDCDIPESGDRKPNVYRAGFRRYELRQDSERKDYILFDTQENCEVKIEDEEYGDRKIKGADLIVDTREKEYFLIRFNDGPFACFDVDNNKLIPLVGQSESEKYKLYTTKSGHVILIDRQKRKAQFDFVRKKMLDCAGSCMVGCATLLSDTCSGYTYININCVDGYQGMINIDTGEVIEIQGAIPFCEKYCMLLCETANFLIDKQEKFCMMIADHFIPRYIAGKDGREYFVFSKPGGSVRQDSVAKLLEKDNCIIDARSKMSPCVGFSADGWSAVPGGLYSKKIFSILEVGKQGLRKPKKQAIVSAKKSLFDQYMYCMLSNGSILFLAGANLEPAAIYKAKKYFCFRDGIYVECASGERKYFDFESGRESIILSSVKTNKYIIMRLKYKGNVFVKIFDHKTRRELLFLSLSEAIVDVCETEVDGLSGIFIQCKDAHMFPEKVKHAIFDNKNCVFTFYKDEETLFSCHVMLKVLCKKVQSPKGVFIGIPSEWSFLSYSDIHAYGSKSCENFVKKGGLTDVPQPPLPEGPEALDAREITSGKKALAAIPGSLGDGRAAPSRFCTGKRLRKTGRKRKRKVMGEVPLEGGQHMIHAVQAMFKKEKEVKKKKITGKQPRRSGDFDNSLGDMHSKQIFLLNCMNSGRGKDGEPPKKKRKVKL